MSSKNLVGQRFGKLVVLERTDRKQRSCYLWRCKCDCGNETLVDTTSLTRFQRKSCGCLATSPKIDLQGKVFGRLTVLEFAHESKKGALWKCQCSCGNIVKFTTYQLNCGIVKSCGCLHTDVASEQLKENRKSSYVDGTSLAAIKSKAVHRNNTSGARGVTWHKGRGKWTARITFKGERISLGYFDDLSDAAEARKNGEEKYYGKYLASKDVGNNGQGK